MQNILRPSQAELQEMFHQNSVHIPSKSEVNQPQKLQDVKIIMPQPPLQSKSSQITESRINKTHQNTLFIYQSLGMFVFTFGQLCIKQPNDIHFQIAVLLIVAIPFCASISGANFNPSVTIGFGGCNFDKYRWNILWLYFKTQFFTAFCAQILAYYLNNNAMFNSLMNDPQITPEQIIASQFMGSLSLVFFILLICDQRTSPIRNSQPISTMLYISLLVYVSRKFAVNSYNAINPAITLSQGLFRLFSDLSLDDLKFSIYFIIGDIMGALFGVYCQKWISQIKSEIIQANTNKIREQSMYYSETQMKNMK